MKQISNNEKIVRREVKEMGFHENFDMFLRNKRALGRQELKRKYLAYFDGDEVNGLPWQWIKEMLDRGYISQDDMNYIVY